MKRMLRIKKTLNILVILCLSLSGLVACDNQIDDWVDSLGDDDSIVCDDDTTTVVFKRVAYWSVSDDETLDDIDFSMLTHIIYNKIGIDSGGELSLPTGDDLDEFEEMIELADTAGIYAMVSIGNSSDTAFNAIAVDDDALDNFRDNLEDLIDEYDLDGIDINWQFPEGDDEGDLFEDLMKEMDDLATDEGILLSYVVDTGQDDDATDDGVQDDVLGYGDFLNVMALDTSDYDDPLEDAEEAIEYWTDRCVVKNRLVLAIPVYSEGDAELDFSEIIDDDTSNACYDYASNVEDSDGNEYDDITYNGIPTVTDKTEYAESYAGGVILTSLDQDYLDEDSYSLLTTIYWQSYLAAPNDICD
ncbi:glycoside hydrolase family 18 protein [Psychromonas algicola]|uniref:glycoside hydrolase family 18 protein n=1 Tax=Psychromonas algicola TaxID=2555642 RepID=UPI0010687758|nr:glycoside hydrolase family 18 protein [Psychromonas sp. RZ5]TEW52921.1 glycoside hydrolase family 18 protein [Psychromonas sp. RZ5]